MNKVKGAFEFLDRVDQGRVMEGTEGGESGGAFRYTLKPSRISNEDILFCVDSDAETLVETKTTSSNGRPFTRLDSIKQAILLFLHAKSSINPDHRFAFSTLATSVSWLRKEFSSDVETSAAVVRGLSATSSCTHADLTSLFRLAASEAKKSRAQNRILRVILIYCRSSTIPQHQWPVNQKLFTLDVVYLHDKPGPENNPQEVYDALVDCLDHVSEYEGYIFESGKVAARVLFRYICVLLSHPQQRCPQELVDIPRPLAKKSDPVPADEVVPVSSQ